MKFSDGNVVQKLRTNVDSKTLCLSIFLYQQSRTQIIARNVHVNSEIKIEILLY